MINGYRVILIEETGEESVLTGYRHDTWQQANNEAIGADLNEELRYRIETVSGYLDDDYPVGYRDNEYFDFDREYSDDEA
jgi:hypothetical protein